jgi:hypothetical protein
MDTEHIQHDYRRLEQAASKALEDPAALPPSPTFPVPRCFLRLWQYPAFAKYTAWFISHSSTTASQTPVRRVTWDQVPDKEQLAHRLASAPERFVDRISRAKEGIAARPTLEIHDGFVETTLYQSYLTELSNQPLLHVFPHHPPVGLDGETAGVELSQFGSCVRLEWWGDGPDEWNAVITSVQHLHQFLLQHVIT